MSNVKRITTLQRSKSVVKKDLNSTQQNLNANRLMKHLNVFKKSTLYVINANQMMNKYILQMAFVVRMDNTPILVHAKILVETVNNPWLLMVVLAKNAWMVTFNTQMNVALLDRIIIQLNAHLTRYLIVMSRFLIKFANLAKRDMYCSISIIS